MFPQVKIYVGPTQSYAVNDSLVRVFNDDNFAAGMRSTSRSAQSLKSLSVIETWQRLYRYQSVYCDDLLSNTNVMEEISHADLVVGEFVYLCSTLIADKFSLPLVMVSVTSLDAPTAFAFGLPAPPSYIPQFGVTLSDMLTFSERARSLLGWIFLYGSYIYDLCPPFEKIKAKHNITPDKNIQETLGRVDIIIGQMDFSIDNPRPLYPNTRVVGPFIASPAKSLPDELNQFVQKAGDEGVILVSFGTVVEAVSDLSLKIMAETFSKLPQKIIWNLKPNDSSKLSISDNVKLLPWLPQNDILGHPKTRLFIAHAGLNGMLESAYHGVPMICSPFFGDQSHNAQAAKQAGFAEVVDLDSTSTEEFFNLIQKMLTDRRYREKAQRISKSVQQLPRSPVKEAADWVEYTQAQGGLQYLRPRGLDLPFYKLFFIDVLFVVLLVLVVVLLIIILMFRSVLRCLSGSSRKQKVN
ncbi:UDP-glucuronosyltransferase 2B23 [Stylophora pistillata]|uniref:UDP-glucuronosyltransferase n=1 Tax=Stylophora pistillata TaxID=50429 RepID=A0A2B4T0T3_STYPI|nr:UDP-glucuronosyltransferase 2B23 [Stylophora pistillata]